MAKSSDMVKVEVLVEFKWDPKGHERLKMSRDPIKYELVEAGKLMQMPREKAQKWARFGRVRILNEPTQEPKTTEGSGGGN
ncbi:MAG: hypothetical protein KC729_00080 [Candidatus Eisenbacteria bacterium]|uniref:Uncharacterized protein n=1 Tax=Eiseniibacteriota bacterium TaxID=2212470 RepID=A0A956LW43_UNCEI|nr:hypothetical protein [Candidatus Eisenbacteria bacterium]